MDYEEILLQITDVLKSHNRYHMKSPDHEQAVKAIRDIVTPKGEWIADDEWGNCHCSICRFENNHQPNFCENCGSDMRGDV